jgi:NhaP-type Na+/H+ or K+/H+ antiporter
LNDRALLVYYFPLQNELSWEGGMTWNVPLILNLAGALAFGLVVGWVTSSTLRRAKRDGLTDISTVIGAVGGAAITGLFAKETGAFGIYCVGLAIGFWWYISSAVKPGAPDWLGEEPTLGGAVHTDNPLPPIRRP